MPHGPEVDALRKKVKDQDMEIAKLKRLKNPIRTEPNLSESELEEEVRIGVKERGMAQKWENDEAHAYYDGLVKRRVKKKMRKPAETLPF